LGFICDDIIAAFEMSPIKFHFSELNGKRLSISMPSIFEGALIER
jgi:hypothetical protein